MIFIIWIVCSIAIGVYANKLGRNGFWWGGLSFVVSPLLAGVLLLFLGEESGAGFKVNGVAVRGGVRPERVVDQLGKSWGLVGKKLVSEAEHRSLVQQFIQEIKQDGIFGTETDFLAALVTLVDTGALTMDDVASIKTAIQRRNEPLFKTAI